MLRTKILRKLNYRTISCMPNPIRNPQIQFTGIFRDNDWHKSVTRKTFETINPANEKIIAHVQHGGREDIHCAITAAKHAFRLGSQWRKIDPSGRGVLLNSLADLMERDHHYLASLETLDNGKPFSVAYNLDVPLAIRTLRYFAGWSDKVQGKTIPVDGDFLVYTTLEPVGICAQIIPWNFPILMMAWKLGPALATGNCVIVKPSELTPLTALYIAQLTKEAGFPPGVIGVIPGAEDTGSLLAKHNRIDKVAFTGSTAVGKEILQASGKTNLKRVTLELGGKSPNIVLADANLDFAVETSHFGLFFNMGQCCCAGSRTYVEEKIYDEFVERSAERAKRKIIGDPFDIRTEHGPQIDREQMNRILTLIQSGVKEKAKLVTGGNRCQSIQSGYYIEPTVFADVKDDMRIAREEIFGPVQQIMPFKCLDEVIIRANHSNYGLAAGVITKDIDKANYIIERLRVGTVWVNTYNVLPAQAPFGGFKMSGFGRENGEYALQNYTEVKSVIVKVPEKNCLCNV